MAAAIPTSMPSSIFAGDTLEFEFLDSAYTRAEGYTLNITFVKSGAAYTITSSAAGSNGGFLFTVATTTTDDWTAGTYDYQIYATKSGERRNVGFGSFEVKSNYATATTGLDGRSIVKKTLDALENTFYSRASEKELSMSVGDRTISKMSHAQLIEAIGLYKQLYQRELDAARLASGQANTNNSIYVRFN